MLTGLKSYKNFKIHSLDGDIGHINDTLFDDEQWGVRYLVIDTGIIFGRRVLIAPRAIKGDPDWINKEFHIALTKDQIKKSPDLDADAPISRRHEQQLNAYYGWPYYWTSGTPMTAGDYAIPYPASNVALKDPEEETHVRSAKEVCSYAIEASDGDIGRVRDFIVNDDWKIRYVLADAQKGPGTHDVLLSVSWIKEISWADSRVVVDVTKDQVQNSPAYNAMMPLNRAYEEQLFKHYRRPVDW